MNSKTIVTSTTTSKTINYDGMDKYERFECWLRENGGRFEMLALEEYSSTNNNNSDDTNNDDDNVHIESTLDYDSAEEKKETAITPMSDDNKNESARNNKVQMPRRSTRQRKKVVYKDFETGSTSEEESDAPDPPPPKKRRQPVIHEKEWNPEDIESDDGESENIVEETPVVADEDDDWEDSQLSRAPRASRVTSKRKRKNTGGRSQPPKKRQKPSVPSLPKKRKPVFGRRASLNQESKPNANRRSSLPPSLPSLPNLNSQWESRELHENEAEAEVLEEEPAAPAIVWLGNAQSDCVGLRYYSGTLTNGEKGVLVREPRNAYDKNAIRFLNQGGDQIGHINRHDAARLAPMMDQWPDFRVEAIALRGANNIYQMTLTLNFFGQESYRSTVQNGCKYMTSFRLNMDFNAAPQTGNSKKAGTSESAILADLDQIFDSILPYNKMPEVKTPEKLLVNLYEHQRKALWWCLTREVPETVETALQKQEKLDKKLTTIMCWRRGRNGTYQNIATNYTTATPPNLPCGGILADDMGLGKTITSLALIQEQKNRGATGCTLIVLPLSIMMQWEETILTRAPDLTVTRYHGPDREKSAKKLVQYDIVLTTYNLIGLEVGGKRKSGPLRKISWLRIILDESHIIRNRKTKACIGICELQAQARWCLTGTPMQNKVDDIHSQVKFLRIDPFHDSSWWARTITRPIRNRDKSGLERLCILMKSICLRRDKKMKVKAANGKFRPLILLPKCAQTVMHVTLPPKDRAIYEKWLKEGRGLMNSGDAPFASMLQVLLRMRQACCHSQLLPDGGKQEPNLDADLITKLLDVLKNSGDEDCPICFDSLVECKACITACGHLFCMDCINAHLRENKPNCPMCRAPVKASDLVEQPPEDSEEKSELKGGSEKISGMIQYIDKVRADEKVVLFSQFTKFLDIIENSFEEHGISCVRLDGRMSISKRMKAIRRFQTESPEKSKVFLISLKAGGVGLNLVRANHVILADPWWNPATEDQAVDRVFRIGQTRNVCIVRMIVKDSIEDKILKLHTKKRQMAKTLFSKSKKELKEIKLQEMKLMLE